MKLFSSVIYTGFFFGIISGLLSVICIIFPANHELKDFIQLTIVVASIILSQIYVDINNRKEPFYPIFFSSSITFLCFPLGFWLYFKLIQNPIEGQWLILLGLGITACFVTSIFTAHFRAKKNLNKL